MKRIKYFIFTLLAASTIFVSCDLDRNRWISLQKMISGPAKIMRSWL